MSANKQGNRTSGSVDRHVHEATQRLLETYNDLNANVVDILQDDPSPLEFMQYVARNRPFVVRGGASSWKASQRWSASYLRDVLGSAEVNVAITPHG